MTFICLTVSKHRVVPKTKKGFPPNLGWTLGKRGKSCKFLLIIAL